MKQALAPILFADNDKPAAAAKRANPVAAAQRSDEALDKAARKRTPDDTPVHSFTSLLADLATLCANHIQPADDMPAFTMTTTPTPLQRRAFEPRHLPPPRPGVVSTPTPPDHKTPGQHPNPSTNQGELRTSAANTVVWGSIDPMDRLCHAIAIARAHCRLFWKFSAGKGSRRGRRSLPAVGVRRGG